jgi:hypothetical protein
MIQWLNEKGQKNKRGKVYTPNTQIPGRSQVYTPNTQIPGSSQVYTPNTNTW